MQLPQPTNEQLKRSEQLSNHIRKTIGRDKSIPFSKFMQEALYNKEFGYYACQNPFGATGDFITAPEITPLFAQTIAQTYLQIKGNILELGAGSGRFARDIILTLAAKNKLPNNYFIIEPNSACRKTQKNLLTKDCKKYLAKIKWIDKIPNNFNGLIFANEVLDALPFDCFVYQNKKFFSQNVTWQNNKFTLDMQHPITNKAQLKILEQIEGLPHGYCSEIRTNITKFIIEIGKKLTQGLILIFDYGYGREEYYYPQRITGTKQCFYNHLQHQNPLLWPGLQDITAHVDFTTVAHALCDAGLSILGYTTQAGFLLESGITKIAASTITKLENTWQNSQAIKKLTLPQEMGEIIKVIAASPNPELELTGFTLQNHKKYL